MGQASSTFLYTNNYPYAGDENCLDAHFKRGLLKAGKRLSHGKAKTLAKNMSKTNKGTSEQQDRPLTLTGILKKESSIPASALRNDPNSTWSELRTRKSFQQSPAIPEESSNPLANGNELNNNEPSVSNDTITSQMTDQNENPDDSVATLAQSQQDAADVVQPSDIANSNTERPFIPEPWPTRSVVEAFLAKSEREPTTVILARFLNRTLRRPVEIKYSYDRYHQKAVFETSEGLDTLVQLREGVVLGETTEAKMEFFFRIFKTCINSLQGQVFWNGYSLILDRTPKRRLRISGHEQDPSQILFEVADMNDLAVHRTSHKVELRGTYGSPPAPNPAQETTGAYADNEKYFRIRGRNAKDVRVNKSRSSSVTMHLPEFNSELIVYPA